MIYVDIALFAIAVYVKWLKRQIDRAFDVDDGIDLGGN